MLHFEHYLVCVGIDLLRCLVHHSGFSCIKLDLLSYSEIVCCSVCDYLSWISFASPYSTLLVLFSWCFEWWSLLQNNRRPFCKWSCLLTRPVWRNPSQYSTTRSAGPGSKGEWSTPAPVLILIICISWSDVDLGKLPGKKWTHIHQCNSVSRLWLQRIDWFHLYFI